MAQAWDKGIEPMTLLPFHISLPSLKFTIFIHFITLTMTSTVLILAGACHIRTRLNDLALHDFSQLSGQSSRTVFGRSWVRFLWGIHIFALAHAGQFTFQQFDCFVDQCDQSIRCRQTCFLLKRTRNKRQARTQKLRR